MEMNIYGAGDGKNYIVEYKKNDAELVAFLTHDEVQRFMKLLPNKYKICQYISDIADDVITNISYNETVRFLKEHKRESCRVLIKNQGFWALEPINL